VLQEAEGARATKRHKVFFLENFTARCHFKR
jgi:hypothetical protein